jgi:DNA-binding transcriptional LysR family regulator
VELTLAQSSVSRTVAEVERAIGARIFERSTRHVELTAEGRAFAEMATGVVRQYDEGFAHFAGYLDGTGGVLRIAALPSLAATLLPQVLSRFRRDRPGVQLEVEDVLASEVVDHVRDGSVDLALTAATAPGPAPPRTVGGLPFAAVAADEFRCLVHPEHAWASRRSVRWDDLAREAFVCFDPASSVRVLVDATLDARGLEPPRRITARNLATVAGLVAAGLGVTAVPALVLPMMEFAGLVSLPLREPTLRRHVGLLSDPRRRRSEAAAALVQVLRAQADEGAALPAGASWAAP